MFTRRLTNKFTACKDFLAVDQNRLNVALLCLGIGASMMASVYLKVPKQGGTNES